MRPGGWALWVTALTPPAPAANKRVPGFFWKPGFLYVLGALWGTLYCLAAVVVAAATAVASAYQAVVAAATEQDEQDDDPPAAVAAPGIVIAHNRTSKKNF